MPSRRDSRAAERLRSRASDPESAEDFATTCEALRKRIVAEVEAGRLKGIAEAMQLSVSIERTEDGASGILEDVIPHKLEGNYIRKCLRVRLGW